LLHQWDRMLAEGELDAKPAPVVVLTPGAGAEKPRFENIPIHAVGQLSGNLWEQVDLPRAAAGHRLFNPCNSAPWIKSRGQVVTIHDGAIFAVPDAYSFAYRLKHRLLYRRFATAASAIITVSEFSKRELVRWCAISPARIKVTYPGCEHILSRPPDPGILERGGLRKRPFVLAMGSHSLHKNVAAVLELQPLLRRLGLDLAVVGSHGGKVFRSVRYEQTHSVHWLGSVSDRELRCLYEHAALFVFPSLYEGFGLPPLEAMACGCPVVLSNAASLPEIGGPDALYCDPRDRDSIAESVEAALSDTALRERLMRMGRRRARQFNWRDCALQTWRLLQA
jgi:glycosyltransferase involved in cell wall biosynthesis